MRVRTLLTATLAAALAAGVAVPSVAAPPKKKPKPIKGSYTAQALPDPTPYLGEPCEPTSPLAMHERPFTVPAKGVLHLETQNVLDWAIAVLTEDGEVLGAEDGGTPEVKEKLDVSFRRKTKVILRACNFAGEPQVTVNYVFTYK